MNEALLVGVFESAGDLDDDLERIFFAVGVAGFEIVGWNALYAPKGTPPAVVRKLADAATRVMRQPETRDKLLQIGLDPRTMAGDELVKFMSAERDKWGQVIRSANLQVE